MMILLIFLLLIKVIEQQREQYKHIQISPNGDDDEGGVLYDNVEEWLQEAVANRAILLPNLLLIILLLILHRYKITEVSIEGMCTH